MVPHCARDAEAAARVKINAQGFFLLSNAAAVQFECRIRYSWDDHPHCLAIPGIEMPVSRGLQ